MRLTGLTDEELSVERDALREILKEITDELNARRKRAAKETIRLASQSREEAGERIRDEPEPDDGLPQW